MLFIKNAYVKYLFLFLFGGFLYVIVELLFNGSSHISMLIAGGLCFVLIGLINEVFPWNMSLISQMFLSSIVITVIEFITGLIVNVWLKFHVWDYSHIPYNFLGQICLVYTICWFFLSLPAILLDDWLRYKLLGEEKPKYKVF